MQGQAPQGVRDTRKQAYKTDEKWMDGRRNHDKSAGSACESTLYTQPRDRENRRTLKIRDWRRLPGPRILRSNPITPFVYRIGGFRGSSLRLCEGSADRIHG